MIAAAVILASIAVLVVTGAVCLRSRARAATKKVAEEGMRKALDQAALERDAELAALPDPDKTPTPLEAANALRRYRDLGGN